MKSRLPMIIDYTKNPIRLQRQNFGHSLWGPSAPPELPAVDTPLERWYWTRSAVYSSVRLAPRTHSGWSWWEASKPPSQSLLALHPESARSARSTFGSMHHPPPEYRVAQVPVESCAVPAPGVQKFHCDGCPLWVPHPMSIHLASLV